MKRERTSERGDQGIWAIRLRTYGVALLCVVIASWTTSLLLPWLYPTTMPLFLVAVMVSAGYGGWRSGLLASVLSTLSVSYFFVEPFFSFQIFTLETMVRLSTFLITTGVISVLTQSRRTALANARDALQSLRAAISQEQAASAEALTAKERLETVLSGINDGFYALDGNWRFTYVNERYCEMVQMQPSALLGRILWEIFPDAVDTEAYVQFHRAMRQRQPLQFDYLYEPWNCWHDHRVSPSAAGLTVLIADITARKQAEAALQKNNERFEMAMQAVDGIVFEWDLETGYVYRSEGLFQLVGVRVEEALPTREWWRDRIHPDDRWRVESLAESKVGNLERYQGEYRVRHEAGHWVAVWEQSYLKRNSQGELVGVIGCTTNIANRKKAEAEREQLLQRELLLRQQAEATEVKLQQVLASIREDFVLFDHDWCITYLNEQAAETMKLSPKEALGKNIWALFPDLVGSEFYERAHQVMRDRTPIQFEYYYSTWDIWFENRLYPTSDGTVHLCSNVTERKRSELKEQFLNQLDGRLRQLSTADAMVQETVSSVGEFLKVDRCWWNRMDVVEGLSMVEQDWRRSELPSIVGSYRISEFISPELEAPLQRGHPAIISDVTTSPDTVAFADNFGLLNICAFLSAPSVHEGQWISTLSVSSETARQWRADEVVLLQEVVARLWSLIEYTRAVQNLRQSEAEFRLLANAMPQIVWIANADGTLEFVNDRWTEYTGLTLEQSREHSSIRQMIPPEDFGLLQADFAQVQETRSPYQSQFRLVGLDGCYTYFLTRAIPILNEQGAVRHWYGTSTDITELKQLEAELRQKSAILSVINDSTPTLIYVKDREGKILMANPAMLEAVGLSESEVLGHTSLEFQQPREAAEQIMENDRIVIQSGQMSSFEEMVDSPHGQRVFLSVKSPYQNERGRVIGLIGVSFDITERVQLARDRERLLQQEQDAREAAERANRIKDEFLAVVSHELRTPLNPILGWAQLLQRGKLDAAKTQKALATIERNAQLQSQLIDDLLDISRILRGKLSLNMLPVNLRSVIVAALETVHLAAEAKSIQIQTLFSPAVGAVTGDPGRLQQVVWNLLSNAVKFTPAQGQITVTLEQTETQAQIQVTDTGKGIHADFVPHVFEHFRQQDGAITRQFGGLGLGLSIVKQIVELHGGSVTVRSPGEGQGATFTVQIPLASPSIEQPAVKESSAPIGNLNGLNILVVEDELDSREFIVFALEQEGASVISAASADEALQAIEQAIPDVIVSDIGMPETDGYELMEKIRVQTSTSRIPAIALTAYAGELDREAVLAAGFHQHIPKPVDPHRLVSAINTLLKEVFEANTD